jgi:hypothetical protein
MTSTTRSAACAIAPSPVGLDAGGSADEVASAPRRAWVAVRAAWLTEDEEPGPAPGSPVWPAAGEEAAVLRAVDLDDVCARVVVRLAVRAAGVREVVCDRVEPVASVVGAGLAVAVWRVSFLTVPWLTGALPLLADGACETALSLLPAAGAGVAGAAAGTGTAAGSSTAGSFLRAPGESSFLADAAGAASASTAATGSRNRRDAGTALDA